MGKGAEEGRSHQPATGAQFTKRHLQASWLAVAIGLVLSMLGLRYRRPTLGHALAFAVCANALAFGMAAALAYPATPLF